MISGLRADSFAEAAAGAPTLTVRKATMRDIHPILGIIDGYASTGLMLPRTEFELSESIRDFTVVTSKGQDWKRAAELSGGAGPGDAGEELLGCGALHFYSPTVGEIRSLAVREEAKAHGVGRRLVAALVQEALEHGLDAVFAFTYVAGFFEKTGFRVVDRGALPLKAWKDCVRCPKFQACDEIAMLRILRHGHWAETQPSGWLPDIPSAEDQFIQIPTPAK